MMNEITLFVAVVLALVLFFVPKRLVVVVFVVAACFVPAEQRVILADLDFTVLRVMVLTMLLRAWTYGEVRPIRWTSLDKLVLVWALVRATIYMMQWRTFGAMIYESGALLDILGVYWLVRQYVSSWNDIRPIVITLAASVLILLPFVLWESATGMNPFAVLGRVHTALRETETRAQGPFPHSILLGLFWATAVPLFWATAKGSRPAWLFWAAIASSTIITMCTRSSTPILTLFVALGLMQIFKFRPYGKEMAYTLGASIVALHIVMTQPVWHLFARVGVVAGSTGYHRYRLIDSAIGHFSEWAVLGIRSTGHWGWGLQDVTNEYILEGVRGGAVSLILFLWILGKAIRITWRYSLRAPSLSSKWLGWSFSASIIAHAVAFFGVSYFGQSRILFYLTLAMAGMVAETQTVVKSRSPKLAEAQLRMA